MTFVVTAKWTIKEGREQDVEDAILALIEPSRAEPGNLFYQANRDLEDPRVVLFYELYADRAAYEAHGASEHFQRLAHGTAIPLLESRERRFYDTFGPLERRAPC
ncbi:MAG TPA: putative quinol monooxygenase [Baekduia sp.]